MKEIAIKLILIYQRIVSPWLGPHCRFHPSCSEWMRQAIEARGFLKGTALGLGRLARCQPFHPGGYNPLEING